MWSNLCSLTTCKIKAKIYVCGTGPRDELQALITTKKIVPADTVQLEKSTAVGICIKTQNYMKRLTLRRKGKWYLFSKDWW